MVKTVGTFLFYTSILALTACNSNNSKTVKENSTQQTNIKVFFTPGPDCENNIIERINKSNKIDIAVYSITNPNITKAIVAAYNRGTDIRIITDRVQAKGKKSLIETIKKAGVPVLTNKKT